MHFPNLIKKAQSGDPLSKDELIQMLDYPSDSTQAFAIMAESNRISKELSGGKAEVHAQFALNLRPVPAIVSSALLR